MKIESAVGNRTGESVEQTATSSITVTNVETASLQLPLRK